MLLCTKCERRKRVKTLLKAENKKKYWISYCLSCDSPVAMEDHEPNPKKNDKNNK